MTVVQAVDDLLTSTVERVLHDHAEPAAIRQAEDDASEWLPALWAAFVDAGLPWIGTPEDAGGSGGSPSEAAEIVRLAAAFAAPIPIAETALIAAPSLAANGLAVPNAALAVAPHVGELAISKSPDGWVVDGTASYVAWARSAAGMVAVVALDEGLRLAYLPLAAARVERGVNYANEQRDRVTFASVAIPSGSVAGAPASIEEWALRGAWARSVQIAGAVERALDETIEYAKQRRQFGRPIVQFQAVAHMLTQLGECAAEARVAADLATAAVAGRGFGHRSTAAEVTAAKVVTSAAASKACSFAHQIFGAIGMTRECDLQLFTRRLWSWRAEYGTELGLAADLGRDVVGWSPDRIWHTIAADPYAAE